MKSIHLCMALSITLCLSACGGSSSSSDRTSSATLAVDELNDIDVASASTEEITVYFEQLLSLADSKQREALVDETWMQLKNTGRIPATDSDSVLFLYRDKAASHVTWNGDFNNWGGDSTMAAIGTAYGFTGVWSADVALPSSARFDYQIVVDGNWMTDPNNPHQQMGGFGPNSELRMPDFAPHSVFDADDNIDKGVLAARKWINSPQLGYDVSYRVYLPAHYGTNNDMPVLYVTDGPDFESDEFAGLIITLNQLIAQQIIQPLITVFVSPVDKQGTNRRQAQYANDYEPFGEFVTDTLIPAIDKDFKTTKNAQDRGIIGVSMGGLVSAYFGVAHSNDVQRIGILSPSLLHDQRFNNRFVMNAYESSIDLPIRVALTTGTYHDRLDVSQGLKLVLESKGYPVWYQEKHDGHSWGNWRHILPDVLAYLYPFGE